MKLSSLQYGISVVFIFLWNPNPAEALQYLALRSRVPAEKRAPIISSSPSALFGGSNNIDGIAGSRRNFLAASSSLVFGTLLSTPQPSNAVAPVTEKEIDSGLMGLPPRQRPKPPSAKQTPRQDLNLDFAVLLTRSSYIEAAQMGIGPVDQLERDMYLVRTAEYQPYRNSLVDTTLKQGDLTDPYYFDYMSFVQYLTINRALKDPQTEYDQEETIMDDNGLQTTKFKTVHVQRTVPDTMLVATHNERVGATILSYLQDRFGNTSIAIPSVDRSSSTDLSKEEQSDQILLKALSQLVNLFLISGFAWEGQAELVRNGKMQFVLTLQNPATLWSAQCLAKAKAPLRNDFLLQTAQQLVQSMGYTVSSSSMKLDGTKEISYLTLE